MSALKVGRKISKYEDLKDRGRLVENIEDFVLDTLRYQGKHQWKNLYVKYAEYFGLKIPTDFSLKSKEVNIGPDSAPYKTLKFILYRLKNDKCITNAYGFWWAI